MNQNIMLILTLTGGIIIGVGISIIFFLQKIQYLTSHIKNLDEAMIKISEALNNKETAK